jgi:hypothetical protein
MAKAGGAYLDADQIMQLYRSVNRGIHNYYGLLDNWSLLSRIQDILRYSLAKTLAMKHNLSLPKVFKRFGKNLETDENTLQAGAPVLHLRRKCSANGDAPRPAQTKALSSTRTNGLQPDTASHQPETNPCLRKLPWKNPPS